ncbi:MAG TPA: hypothetical protein DDX40_03235 [Rikenellaceae bacterium]|nr:hypothetical protein [Rikenellaceae bacterium]
MKINNRNFLSLLVLLASMSCAKEDVLEKVVDEPATEAGSSIDHSVVPGIAFVEFSDEMIALVGDDLSQGKVVTRSMGLNQALDELGIKSIERAFPDAGEFEPRHRKAGLHKCYIIEYSESVAVTRASSELLSIPGVERVESQRAVVPADFNDPSFSSQWGLYNISYPQYDINVVPVWNNYTTGDPKVVVAVVDYGIDMSHPDLKDNCSATNYSSIDHVASVKVENAGNHGTHVAGIIAAVNNNGVGIRGVAGGDAAKGKKGATLMSCEIFRDYAEGGKTKTKQGSIPTAIIWAADHGAVICQNSWSYNYDSNGDGWLDETEKAKAMRGEVGYWDKRAIDYFIDHAGCDKDGNQLPDSPMKGGLVVFAAGNDNIGNGVPSNYDRVIAVAALNSNGSKANYSNYGDFVDLAAPGTGIYSTVTGGGYRNMNGTSMACPHVSGVAALIVSMCGGQGFTNDMLKEKLLKTRRADVVSAGMGGLVDAMAALNYGETFKPGKAGDVKAAVRANSVDISWTSVANADGYPAYGYKVICGKDRSLVENADPSKNTAAGTFTRSVLAKAEVGSTEKITFRDLDFSSTYYVKVVGYSYMNVYGEPSPVIEFKTVVNNPPVIKSDVSGDIVLRSHEKKVINLVITDPDRHTITADYQPGSPADTFSGLDKGEATITINAPAAGPGTYTATLTATDNYGAATTLAITYTILANNPPEKIKDASNLLIHNLGETFVLKMNEYFNDPDGETLEYDLSSTDPQTVRLVSNGGNVFGTVLKYGSSAIVVKATDAAGSSAEIGFKVLAREASVEYSAYPNPVKDFLNIGTGPELAETHVRIVSQTGRTAFDGTVMASAFEPARIDLSGQAPGVYSVIIRIGGKTHTFAVVKR